MTEPNEQEKEPDGSPLRLRDPQATAAGLEWRVAVATLGFADNVIVTVIDGGPEKPGLRYKVEPGLGASRLGYVSRENAYRPTWQEASDLALEFARRVMRLAEARKKADALHHQVRQVLQSPQPQEAPDG